MGRGELGGRGGCSEVSTMKNTNPQHPLKLISRFSPLLFSWERERSGEGESLEWFGARGLGSSCQMCTNAVEEKQISSSERGDFAAP